MRLQLAVMSSAGEMGAYESMGAPERNEAHTVGTPLAFSSPCSPYDPSGRAVRHGRGHRRMELNPASSGSQEDEDVDS